MTWGTRLLQLGVGGIWMSQMARALWEQYQGER